MTELPIEPRRGGFRKPLGVRVFILDYLGRVGEDHTSAIHRAYKQALRELGEANPILPKTKRGKPKPRKYKHCTYYSFKDELEAMQREGLIQKARAEPSWIEKWGEEVLHQFWRLV